MSTYKIAFNTMNEFAGRKLMQSEPGWAAFNDGFVNMELDIIDIMYHIHAGHAYTTWHEGRRNVDNFTIGQHLAIDMDTNDERSSIATLKRHPLVRMYGGIVHTSPSHTPEAPRARVIFLLDEPIKSAAGYTEATKFLIDQFDGCDKACKDAARFFYGAKDCDLWFDGNEFPIPTLRTYYKRWSTQKQKTQTRQKQDTFVPRTTGNTDIAQVEAALSLIDPWRISYQEWVSVLAALHEGFGDVALPLATRWGQGKDHEVERKWKSFGRYPGQRAGLGTIFHLAGGVH